MNNKIKLTNEDFEKEFKEIIPTIIEDKMTINSFINQLKVFTINDNEVVFIAPNIEIKNYLNEEHNKDINAAILMVIGKPLKSQIIIPGQDIDTTPENNSVSLNKEYTFSNYTKVKFNKEAINIAKKVVENPGEFSPYYISGKSGLGKTHLLHAIGNKLSNKGLRVYYLQPNKFIERIQLARNKKKYKETITYITNDFNNYDVILFDDIQNMVHANTTLKVLFNVINDFLDSKKQIVIASDKVSQQLSGFEDRYVTRFESGISTIIEKPNDNDMTKILIDKLKIENIDPSMWEEEALNFIVRNHNTSVRSLEGAIKRIKYFNLNNNNIKYTSTAINNIFNKMVIDVVNLTPDRVMTVVASYYKISKTSITGKSRKKEFVLARHIAMYLIRNTLHLSYKNIGKLFSNRDHSTIINAVNSIQSKVELDNTCKIAIKKIEQKIKTIS